MTDTTRSLQLTVASAAIVAGLAIGAIDTQSEEVQGTALLLGIVGTS